MANESTYAAVVDGWLAERLALGQVAEYTARKAAAKARLFCGQLGDVDVDDIQPRDIVSAMVELRRTGRRGGRSSSTIKAAHQAATQACDWAVRNSMSRQNPFRLVPRPKANYRRARFLDRDEAERLAQAAMDGLAEAEERADACGTGFYCAVLLALMTGMRRGEVFALRWESVDLAHRTVSVRDAIKSGGEVGAPKSAAGTRVVSIGANLADALARHRAVQGDGHKLVIDGMTLNQLEHRWRAWADSLGGECVGLRFHELRHTHATLLIASGADVKTVQTRLGHSSATITMQVYAHALPRADAEAASSFDSAMLGGGA